MPTKKTILIINYYWPPCGGPAVQRWLDFANRMVMDNFNVHVLTVSNHTATFTSLDLSLIGEIQPSVKVHYADASDFFWLYKKFLGKGKVPGNALADETKPGLLKKIARFIRGNFFLPDPRRGWNKNAEKKALELIQHYSVDTIITAGPPQSSHLIGLNIKAKLKKIRWIADMHDYWTDVFFLEKFYRTSIAAWIDRRYELSVLLKANIILTHSQHGKNLLDKKVFNKCKSDKIHLIRMGYDENKLVVPKYKNESTTYRITYSGTLPDYYNPEVVFIGINELLNEHKELNISLNLVGTIAPNIKQFIEKLNKLSTCTRFHGYLSHNDSIEILLNSNLLLLFNPNVKNDKGIVPGKIYEYMATGIPILSVSSHGSENEFLLFNAQSGKNFERTDKKKIKQYILDNILHPILNENRPQLEFSRFKVYKKLRQLL